MNRLVMLILAAIVMLALVGYTATYTVRFTETAVLTTFGRAGENDVKREPGLNFKWPYPIQSVTTYDKRQRLLQTVSETQQTADNRQVVVEAFCIWRVDDPLKFFQRFSSAGPRADEHYRKAEEALRGLLRSALGAVSQYRMDQMFTADPSGTKLPELEKRILDTISAKGPTGQSLSDLGLAVVDVGVNRVRLPEETSKAVFDAMGANRDRLAKDIEAKAQAVADAIKAQAEANALRIRAFAERRAQEIRAAGDLEAAQYLRQMNSNPELAVFLKNMEFIRDVMAKRITLVLPSSMPGMSLLSPDAVDSLKSGQIPDFNAPADWNLVPAAPGSEGDPAKVGSRSTDDSTATADARTTKPEGSR